MNTLMARLDKRVPGFIDLTWVLGAAALAACLIGWGVPYQQAQFKMVAYAGFGAVFALLWLLGVFACDRVRAGIRIGASAFLFLFSLYFLAAGFFKGAFCIALIQYWLLKKNFSLNKNRDPLPHLALLWACWVSWEAWLHILWWQPVWDKLGRSVHTPFVLLLALVWGVAFLFQKSSKSSRSRRWDSIVTAIALLLLMMAAFRLPRMEHQDAFIHHWGVYAGPAEMVRQGGALLWDVPSQYGFLSILAVAKLPFATSWDSIFWMMGYFQFFIACLIFFALRSLRQDAIGSGFAFFATFAAVFTIPGWAPGEHGPYAFPSVTGMRSVWCYAILAVWIGADQKIGERRWPGQALFGAAVLWAVGSLWAAESWVYCSAAFFPAYGLVLAHRYRSRRKLSELLGWIGLPFGILAVEVLLVQLSYWQRLGHGPDWRAFFDYAISFAGNYMQESIEPKGPVWFLILALALVAWGMARAIFRKVAWVRLAPMASVACTFFAVVSYFAARSHANNATNFMPIALLSLAFVLVCLKRIEGQMDSVVSAPWASAFFISFFGALFFCGYSHGVGTELFLKQMLSFQSDPKVLVPVASPELLDLMKQAGMKPTDPTLSGEFNLAPWMTPDQAFYPAWAPAVPVSLTAPLSKERLEVYFDRFMERVHLSGWFIEPKGHTVYWPFTERVMEIVRKTHRPMQTYESPNWRLTEWVPR